MIHFIIDFENVSSLGLLGSEYLCSDDSVTIFYSSVCLQIENGKMRKILESGCNLDICKLQKAGKNALDFYIASRIGEIYGSGYAGTIAIVSKDKGFRAVQEYWRNASPPKKVVLRADIEQCIVSSGEVSERSRLIQNKKRLIDIESEYQKYQERKRIQKEVEQLFANTDYITKADPIIDIIQAKERPKTMYLKTLKRFGKKDGLQIYNKIKSIA